MMIWASLIIFMLIWSALVWGIATSGDEKNRAWPNFWRLNILVSIIPIFGLVIAAVVPDSFKIWVQDFVQGFMVSSEKTAVLIPPPPPMPGEVMPVVETQSVSWPMVIIALYGIGVIVGAMMLVKGKTQARKIIQNSVYLKSHDLWLTEEDVPPFASNHKGGRVIFPAKLYETLSADQIKLIATHERAHLAHKDPFWIDVLYMVRVVFWFNPFIRDLINKWHVAIELRSDSVTLQNASAPTRKAYAQSFLAALQIPTGGIATPSAAFSNKKIRSEKMRLKNIMSGEGASQQRAPIYLAGLFGGLALIGCTSAAGVTIAADDTPKESNTKVWVSKFGGEQDVDDVEIAFLFDEKQFDDDSRVIVHRNGKRTEREWADLSEEEREEILEELREAEEEMAEAIEEMKEAEIEIAEAMAEAEVEMKEALAEAEVEMREARIEMRIVEKEIAEAEEEMRRELRIELIDAEKEMANAEEEIRRAQKELEKSRAELEREHKRLQKEKK